jgi:hypothetical protein
LTLVVLLILAALWAVVLLPPLLRARTDRSADSIGAFNSRLDVLGKTNASATQPAATAPARRTSTPAPPMYASPVAPAERAAKRRRDVLRALVVAVTITFALAYFTGAPALWAANVLVDGMLIAYLALWAWVRQVQTEQAEKVHYLQRTQAAPELALRRTGSS